MASARTSETGLRVVTTADVRRWYASADDLAACTSSIGAQQLSGEYLDSAIGLPLHLRMVLQAGRRPSGDAAVEALASIPYHSLCRGLLLPLSGMHPERIAYLFRIAASPPPDAAGRQQLLDDFLARPLGLSLEQKLACVLGDPFTGRASTFRRDSLLSLLLSLELTSRRALLDRLTREGEIAALFAQSRTQLKSDPPLTALELLEALRLLPDLRRNDKFALLRSLLGRCGRLEAYFLARLVLRKAGLGFDYQGPVVARALAEHYDAPVEQIAHAIALSDPFRVARLLAEEGVDGLRRIQLQPLVPVRPALASAASVDDVKRYPVWVERKYDGVRLMLHRSTDARGTVLCGAYTRNRGDWLELIPGMQQTLGMLPARQAIIDGELYGTMASPDGVRSATVYEVYTALQGERSVPINLRYAAFDLLYLDGYDLTRLPLSERRRRLEALVGPLSSIPMLPVPITVAQGQLAESADDVKRLYQHFRAQGYEGIIAKDLGGPYLIAQRDPAWRKRKPQQTLDLVLLGAVLAVTTKQKAGMFGSYVIGAKRADGTFEDVGDIAGLDRQRDLQIQQEIMREGLLSGRRIERQSQSGTRPGFELRPHIVVTVKLSGLKKDSSGERLSLRDPKILAIRSDKSPFDADDLAALEKLYLRQRVG